MTSSGERLLEQAREIEASQAVESEPDEWVHDTTGEIFLHGRVSAGYGIEAVEEQTPFSLLAAFGS
ncbi:MAG: hypothetical protein ACYSOQ_08810, partial [Planctomycetota bacterium]